MHRSTNPWALFFAAAALGAMAAASNSCASGETDEPGVTPTTTPWTTTSTTTASGGGTAGGSGGAGALGGGGQGALGGGGAVGGSGGSQAGGGPVGGSGGEAGQGGGLYSHTIPIGGTNPAFEFNTGGYAGLESFATTTGSFTAFFAWDAQFFYVGLTGPDIGTIDGSSASKWVVLYLGGAPSTTTGLNYNGQQPSLPFAAHWQFQWRASNDSTIAKIWDGDSWETASWNFTGDIHLNQAVGQKWLEMRFPLDELGSPATLDVHLSMVNEGTMAGTYAGCPSSSFADGFDPDFTHYFAFDLSGATVPTGHSPL